MGATPTIIYTRDSNFESVLTADPGINLDRLTLQLLRGGERECAMNLKKLAAGAAMVGGLGFGAVGLATGVANAAPAAPVVADAVWQQDRGHWDDWGHDGGRGRDGRDGWGYGGNWGNGPGWGCVSGPFGHVTWCP